MIFDAYNANPDSMKALLDNVRLLDVKGRKVAVLAEMLEMGDAAAELHRQLGREVADADIDIVWFYGSSAADFELGLKDRGFNKKSFISNSYEESLASTVGSMLKTEDLVLVKGSRGMKMERFLPFAGAPEIQSK